jgi:hypothetical protein
LGERELKKELRYFSLSPRRGERAGVREGLLA